MRRACGWAVALLLCALCWSPPARAATDDVDRYVTAAARLYENLEYERALEQLTRARKVSRGVDDDVNIALYEGIILADLGRKEASIAAFKEALYLKPDSKLPVRVSPKVSREFEALRHQIKEELAPILAKREAEQRAREAAEKAKAEQEKARAEAAKAKSGGDNGATAQQDDRPTREPHLIDARPGEVGEGPAGGLAANGAVEKAPPGPPVLPMVLGGVAVAAAGAGGYFGWQSRGHVDAARAASFRQDAVTHLEAARTPAMIANVLFAVAGTAAAGAIVTLVTSGGEVAPQDAPATR